MKIYTLIAYRPDYTDVCRGCAMGSSSSDCQITTTLNREDIIDEYAKYLVKNAERTIEYADYELTLLLDGRGENDFWEDDAEDFEQSPDYTEIPHLAQQRADRILADHRAHQAVLHAENLERVRKAKEQLERQEFERLKLKFAEPT